MPHIHLRGSESLKEQTLDNALVALTKCLSECETIASESIKAYWTHHPRFAMVENAPRGFLHCEVSILAGRPNELRNQIADLMYETLKDSFGDTELSLTFELREMDKATYRK